MDLRRLITALMLVLVTGHCLSQVGTAAPAVHPSAEAVDTIAAPANDPMPGQGEKASFVQWMDDHEPGPWFKKLLSVPGMPHLLSLGSVALVYFFALFASGAVKKWIARNGKEPL